MSRRLSRSFFTVALALVALPAAPALAQRQTQSRTTGARVKVERADQLPPHVYAISTTATALLQDEKQFAAFARPLEADLRADLATYDIQDRATLKSYYGTLADLALLRADYRTAVSYADRMRAIENKPGLGLVAGLAQRAMAAAADAHASPLDTTRFRDAFGREIAALPYTQIQAELAAMTAQMEMMSPNLALGTVQAEIEPSARSGSISRELAQRLVAVNVRINRLMPVRAVLIEELGRTIAAHNLVKSDI